ncbi:MAG: insulinase family protein [Rhizobiales bacterium]|nr:insulinase family protein [Hyphomicrobiales bacterium]
MSVRISRLPNGLHVVTHAMPHLETVALGIWVKAGARDELPEENGIAHFLEHLAFKGTKRRNAQQIAEEIESSGGEINASTGMETTTYYARVLKNDWAMALDILADILTESVFDPAELEREREVILQEIAAANDAPDDLVFDLAQAASFGAHPLGRPILGTSALVENVTREGIIAWRDRHYCASRMVVAAAGHIDHDQLEAACTRLLGHLPPGAAPARSRPAFEASHRQAGKPLDQTHVVLSFAAPGYREPEIYALQVLSSLLGGGMSSRLFQEVREKRGLCYSVFSYASAYEDAGQLGIYAATSPGNAKQLIDVTADVMLSAASEVTASEIARARAQLKASLVMNLESASSRADQIARQFLAFGEVPDVSRLVAKIEAVEVAGVGALATRIFRGRKPALSAVGQLSGLTSHEAIIARFA